jgi:hypothetical protein
MVKDTGGGWSGRTKALTPSILQSHHRDDREKQLHVSSDPNHVQLLEKNKTTMLFCWGICDECMCDMVTKLECEINLM